MASKITSFLRGLVTPGGGEAAEQGAGEAVEYKGFEIRPAPRKEGSQWLTAGVISKQFPEGPKEETFIRAETHGSREQAESFAVTKGKQIIDEQGDRLFRGD